MKSQKSIRKIIIDILWVAFYGAIIYYFCRDGVQRYEFMVIIPFSVYILIVLFPGFIRLPAHIAQEADPAIKQNAADEHFNTWPFQVLGCLGLSYLGFRYGFLMMTPALAVIESFADKYDAIRGPVFFAHLTLQRPFSR